MKENFLHYVWRYRHFDASAMTTTSGQSITLIHPGLYLETEGPDFFNAQLVIGEQHWAGSVEIHLKTSDWYHHHHEVNPQYDNVILHVVWNHDMDVYRANGEVIPVLVLKPLVSEDILYRYQELMKPKSWLYCEKSIATFDFQILTLWKERLYLERLVRKAEAIDMMASVNKNDWEALLFVTLARGFGLNTNAVIFSQMAEKIPFALIRKNRQNLLSLEALFLGLCGLLKEVPQDMYGKQSYHEWQYLKEKYQLETLYDSPSFYQHRPDNFPTVRLTQLAAVYYHHHQVFDAVVQANEPKELLKMFQSPVSDYWAKHYHFDKPRQTKMKFASNSFGQLLIINTILPFLYVYGKVHSSFDYEKILSWLEALTPEKNNILKRWESFGVANKNAFDSQSLLELKKNYCDQQKCLKCNIGHQLLKG
jgi:hypothetical protein